MGDFMAKEKDRKPKSSRHKRPFRSRAFTSYKHFEKAQFNWSALREVLGALLLLAGMVFLFVLFVSVPLIIGRRYGPGWGVLISLMEFPVLALLGVRPGPGVIHGAFSIVITFMIFVVACITTVAYVKSLFR